jgi:DNA-binding NarL/FixJ family response regulator
MGLIRTSTAASVAEARRKMSLNAVDVVLLDSSLRGGADLARETRSARPAPRVVVLASGARQLDVLHWADIGVAGYLDGSESLDDLALLLHQVDRTKFACAPEVVERALRCTRSLSLLVNSDRPDCMGELTHREHDILELVGDGKSNKHIADQLGISIRTVKNHVHSILGKLQVQRRGEAAAVYRDATSASTRRAAAPRSVSSASPYAV